MKDKKLLRAKTYSARFLEPGPCGYQNETVLVHAENLMDIAADFKGMPVCIGHQDLHLMNEADRERETVGYISRVYKKEDGWAWCDYTIDKQKAVDLIDQGCSVSCAYTPTETSGGGMYHNLEYDRRILKGKALHLALVDGPRYEEAKILENSKEEKIMKNIFKFITPKKKEEEVKELTLENSVFEIDGKMIPAKDLVESYLANSKKNEEDDKDDKKENESEKEKDEDASKKENSDDREEDVDGKMVKVSEMKNAYKAAKKNKAEAEEKEAADKKENSLNNKKEAAEGIASFTILENARQSAKGKEAKSNYVSDAKKFAAGAAIYGSKNKAK